MVKQSLIKKDLVDDFNNFFVNVGPQLAKEMNPPQGGGVEKLHGARNPATIFLRETNRDKMIDVVNKFKNKTSLDWNGLDMTLTKQVTDTIVDPLTYI